MRRLKSPARARAVDWLVNRREDGLARLTSSSSSLIMSQGQRGRRRRRQSVGRSDTKFKGTPPPPQAPLIAREREGRREGTAPNITFSAEDLLVYKILPLKEDRSCLGVRDVRQCKRKCVKLNYRDSERRRGDHLVMLLVRSFVRSFIRSSIRPLMGCDGPSFEERASEGGREGGRGRDVRSKIERDEVRARATLRVHLLSPRAQSIPT